MSTGLSILAVLISCFALFTSVMTYRFNRKNKSIEHRTQLLTKIVDTLLALERWEKLEAEGRQLARNLGDFDAYESFDPARINATRKRVESTSQMLSDMPDARIGTTFEKTYHSIHDVQQSVVIAVDEAERSVDRLRGKVAK